MKTKSTQNAFSAGAFRLSSVLGAAAVFAIAATTYAAAQTSSHDAHHPEGTEAQAQMPDSMMGMTKGGMMSGMMQGGGMMRMMENCPMMGGMAAHAEGRIAF